MRTQILLSMILFGLCLCARADDDNPFASDRPLDGRAWLKSSTPGKLLYVRGLYDMALIAPASISAKGGTNDITDALEEFKLPGVTFGDIVAALDGFYTNPSNMRIPIVFALKWVKLQGEEREAEAARLRALYPQDGKSK